VEGEVIGHLFTRVSDDGILLLDVFSSGLLLPHPLNQFLFVKVLEVFATHVVLLLVLFVEGQQFLAASKILFLRFLDGCGGILLFLHPLLKLVHLGLMPVLNFLLQLLHLLSLVPNHRELIFVLLLVGLLEFSDGLRLLFKLLDVLNERSDAHLLLLLLLPKLFHFL